MQLLTLYKKDSKGKIRIRKGQTQGEFLVIHTGLKDGALVEKTKACKGKNIGRANETTPSEQAKSELQSRYNKQLDKGYFPTEKEAQENEVILPMLAQSFDKHSSKIDYHCLDGVYVQQKLDGMRALLIIKDGAVTLMSRAGKVIDTMSHITDKFKGKEDAILDGELYNHSIDFQTQMSLIKKYQEGKSESMQYHIYDKVVAKPYHKRHNELVNYIKNNIKREDIKGIGVCGLVRVRNEGEIEAFHTKSVNDGFEGAMVRHGYREYELGKRSYSLLKYKKFDDEVFKIIDVVAMEQAPSQGKAVCEMEDGSTFEATPKMTHEWREEFLKNKDEYIGELAEVRFFGYTNDGIPRFPIFIGIRIDK